MQITICFNGADEVLAALDALADINGALHDGITQGAKAVEESAKALCPVRTGNLKNSISASVSGLHAQIGTDCHYAQFVEFGTYKSAAKPFLVPALLAAKDSVTAAAANAIKAVSV